MNEKTLRVLEFSKIIEMLVDSTESKLGRDLASQLKPKTNMNEVESAQTETHEAVNLIIRRGRPPMGGIHDIAQELKRAEIGSSLQPINLLNIADSLRSARRLKNYIKQDKQDQESKYDLLEEMILSLNIYKDIEDTIFNAIISEDEISDNASSTLKNIRRQIEVKNASIRNKLNSIINSTTNKKYLQDSIITIRQDRFVVPVKLEYKSNFPGLVHDQSSSGATLFIEPMAIVELNNNLKELRLQEKAEIERILAELTAIVAEVSHDIRYNQGVLAKLDFIFAKGKLALAMKGTKPILNNDGFIMIKQGRHPLLKEEEVVPTTIHIGDSFTSLVITGPNTGGKTVTLKTVGLFTLMSQAGLQIPADYGTKMAVFNNLFADIGDEQSIEQSLSTFSSHMTNIVDILKNIDENSLVLFDELGAGTDPTEGAALAMAILNYLYKKKIRTIATTHYSELKIYALTTEGVENASVEFDVETLSPTYKLLIGVPGKSNAFEISKRLGLQDFIINDARELITKENIEFEDVLATIDKDRKVSEENRAESERLKLEINKLKEELTKKKNQIEDMKQKILREAKQEARKIIKEAKEESEEIVKELRNISSEIEKEKSKKIQESRDRINDKLNLIEDDLTENILAKTNNKPPLNVKKGETVKLLNINQIGTVISVPDSYGNLVVQVGIMKVNVNISIVERAKDTQRSATTARTKSMIKSKLKQIKSEIDLRGNTLEEAILDVDKYLDDAYMTGLGQVHIIHGKGTGVLREGIKQLLKNHRHVSTSRLGEHGEGGNGVTVVEIK